MSDIKNKIYKDYPEKADELKILEEQGVLTDTVIRNFYKEVTLEQKYLTHEITVTLPLRPLKKSRPRSSARLKGGLYDPDDSIKKSYVNYINELLDGIYDYDIIPSKVLFEDTEIFTRIEYYTQAPVSMSKKDKVLGVLGIHQPVSNPDIDNYDKFIFDVLQLTNFMEDDSNIVYHESGKYYSAMPRIEISMKYYNKGR